jgi:hypothetical protein
VKRALLLVVCCLALAPACAEKSNAPAASANGVTVTTKDVADELDAYGANPDYLKRVDDSRKRQGRGAVVGSAPGTYAAGFVAEVVNRQLQYALIHDEVQGRGLTASDECKAAAKNDLLLSFGGNDAQQGEATLAGFPEEFRKRLEGWNVDEYVLQAELAHQPCGSDSVAKAYFDAHTEDFAQDCVSLIVVNDENLANSIVAQTRAGGDFATLASQYSTDQQTVGSGGDAGCHYPGAFSTTLAPTLRATPVGAVTDPISDNAGSFVIFKVNDRKPDAYADAASDAARLAARDQQVELGAWLTQTMTDGGVTVDPRFGTYDPTTHSITPPAGDSESSSSGSEAPPTSSP